MTATMAATDQSLQYTVSSVVTIDEYAIYRLHLDDAVADEDMIHRDFLSNACDKFYTSLAYVMNGRMSSRLGFNWGKLTATRLSQNVYYVQSVLTCIRSIDEDANEYQDYVSSLIRECLSPIPSINVERLYSN